MGAQGHGILRAQQNLEAAGKRFQYLASSPERLEQGLGPSILLSPPGDSKVQPDDPTGLVPQSHPTARRRREMTP